MGFFDEINNLFKEDELDKKFKVECFGQSAVSVSGFKSILNIEEREIAVGLKTGEQIIVTGVRLYIKKLEESEMIIAGKILNISFV